MCRHELVKRVKSDCRVCGSTEGGRGGGDERRASSSTHRERERERERESERGECEGRSNKTPPSVVCVCVQWCSGAVVMCSC